MFERERAHERELSLSSVKEKNLPRRFSIAVLILATATPTAAVAAEAVMAAVIVFANEFIGVVEPARSPFAYSSYASAARCCCCCCSAYKTNAPGTQHYCVVLVILCLHI